ncbi:hypothetical protein [Tenacibaculum singaporense]|uniref:hypothetical protein n=1 Tax=Tenacibaculum singaporense TaxID=2358479 RepID=UPI000F6793FB|nr:hypothetical protein [Tenacibaculum singaporense]RSC96048.1 hypothetical protein EI424_02705 [Tenacibaculum singaporense]
MSITTTDLKAQFGAHYIPEGQNESRLLSALRQKTVTTTYAKPLIYDGDTYRFSNVVLGEIVQQFQKKFTPKGDIEFKPNEIVLRNIKIDLSLYPDDVKASWLGFLESVNEQDRAKWPIVRYMIENEVIPQLKSDLETKGYFKGSYVAPTDGVAGTTAGAIDGVKKLLDAGIADSSMQNVALSAAVTASNAFDLVEEFVDNFDSLLDGVKMRVYMDPKILRWYHRDKRNTHGTDVNYNPDKPVVDFTNVELVGLPSMAGENYLWATPVDNFLYIRRVNGMKKPKVEESKREVFLMTDWWEGLGFGHNELVYVSTWV